MAPMHLYCMRKLILLFLFAFVSAGLYGQTAGHKFEAGVGYSPFTLFTVDCGYNAPYRCNAYFEWRYEFDKNTVDKSFDLGAKLDYKTFPISTAYDYYASYYGTRHDIALLAVGDFNLNLGGIVNPFMGLGFGPGILIEHWTSSKTEDIPEEYKPYYSYKPIPSVNSCFTVIASPRIGIELFRHLRISASVDISLYDFRLPVCFNVGWTF